MMDKCETDKAHGHPPNGPQCISYSQFVAVLAAGNETELKRLCQLLHDPGPYLERYLYELIMTKLLDDDTRRVLESAQCNNFHTLTLRELLSKPGLIISLRLDGKELAVKQYMDLLALDSFINLERNEAYDITTIAAIPLRISGEIEEATILQLVPWDTQTCEELLLCDQADIFCIHSVNSNQQILSLEDGHTNGVDHMS